MEGFGLRVGLQSRYHPKLLLLRRALQALCFHLYLRRGTRLLTPPVMDGLIKADIPPSTAARSALLLNLNFSPLWYQPKFSFLFCDELRFILGRVSHLCEHPRLELAHKGTGQLPAGICKESTQPFKGPSTHRHITSASSRPYLTSPHSLKAVCQCMRQVSTVHNYPYFVRSVSY